MDISLIIRFIGIFFVIAFLVAAAWSFGTGKFYQSSILISLFLVLMALSTFDLELENSVVNLNNTIVGNSFTSTYLKNESQDLATLSRIERWPI